MCVRAHICVYDSHADTHTHTHTMCSWRGIWKYGMEGKGGKKERSKQITEERHAIKTKTKLEKETMKVRKKRVCLHDADTGEHK